MTVQLSMWGSMWLKPIAKNYMTLSPAACLSIWLTGGCFLEMCRRNLERLYLCLYVLFIIDFLFLVIQRTFFLEVFNLLLTPLLALCSS